MVVTVYVPKRLGAHAEITSGFRQERASLHLPRRRRVPHDVRTIFVGVARCPSDRSPAPPELLQRLAEVVDGVSDPARLILRLPAPEPRQKPFVYAAAARDFLAGGVLWPAPMKRLRLQIEPTALAVY